MEPEEDQPELQHEKAKTENPTKDPEFVNASEVPAAKELHSPQMQQWTQFQTTLVSINDPSRVAIESHLRFIN